MSTSEFPPRRAAWWVVGVALAGVLAYTVYQHVGTVVLAVFIYYATRPLFKRLNRIIPSRTLSVVLALFLFTLPALALIGYTVNVVLIEVYNVVQHHELSYAESLVRPYLSEELIRTDWKLLLRSPSEFLAAHGGLNLAQSFYSYALSYLSLFGSVLVNLILTLILAFYFLRDDHRLGRWFRTHLGGYLPHWQVFIDEVDADLQSIFFGNILNAIITAFIGVIVFTAMSFFAPPAIPFPYPALVGMLCGVFSLVPLVGTKIAYLPYAAYLFASALAADANEVLWFPVAFVIISYIIVDTIPDVGLRPYVSGKNVHIGLLMLTYIIAPLMFGWYGLFLGPILLVLGLQFVSHILPHLLEPSVETA